MITNKVEDGDSFTENVTLYAKYTEKTKYLVRFVIESSATDTYVIEWYIPSYDYTEYWIPSKPRWDLFYYTFEGWKTAWSNTLYDNEANPDEGIEQFPEVSAAITYTADFKQHVDNKHTVTYDTNGGNEISKSVEYVDIVEEGGTPKTVILPEAPTKQAYDFAWWKVRGDETETVYYPDNEYPVTEDTDFVAQWTPHDYSIVYDYDGWTLSTEITNPETYNERNIFSN